MNTAVNFRLAPRLHMHGVFERDVLQYQFHGDIPCSRLPLITAFAATAMFAGAAPTIANAADLDGENYSSYTEYRRGYAYRDYSIRPSDEVDEDDDVRYG